MELDVAFLIGSMLAHRQVSIGRGSVVGARSIVGRAQVGRIVLLSAGVSILSGKYQHGRPQERHATGTGRGELQTVSIGDGAWIGQGAPILADVGAHAVVGAGSVVYRAVESRVTVLGNPARRVSLETPSADPAASHRDR